MPEPDDLCICGHPADFHRHLRPGTDCGRCGVVCPDFVPAGHRPPISPQLRRVLAVLAVAVAVLVVLGAAVYAGQWAVAAALALIGGAAVWLLVSPTEEDR